MEIRSYRHPDDADALWALKERFERELGGGGDAKADAYDAKLTDGYRQRYRKWVGRCVEDEPDCLVVAAPGNEGAELGGYAFLLPARLSMIWDAAVLNEIYVRDAYRGTAVAADLLERVVARAREQDLPMDRLVLDVDGENDRARAFYRRHGFEHWGEMVARDL